MPINNGKLPKTKDQVVNAEDITRKALQHVTWEVETFNTKVKADNALDNAGKALRYDAEKALEYNTRKALECGNLPNAKN